MRDKIFEWLTGVIYRRALTVFFICTVVTLIAGGLAEQIRMDMTWKAMVPQNHPASTTFERVIEDFGAATQIIIALEGEHEDQLITAAEALKPALENTTYEVPGKNAADGAKRRPALKRVIIKYNTDFIARHGLLLSKKKDLQQNRKLFSDYNIVPYLRHMNDVLETEYVQNSDNLTKQEKEAVQGLDGMYDFVTSLGTQAQLEETDPDLIRKTVDTITIGRGYLLSTDKKMLLISATPAKSLNAPFDETVAMVNVVEDTLQAVIKKYPGVSGAMTGGHVITRDEMEAGMQDTLRNVTIAFIIILIIFMISFRMVTGPLLAMLVLLAGISWDMGLAYLVVGRLNIFTAMCGVILIGLGVDFALHLLSAFTEFRHKGAGVEEALRETFRRIGGGLVTGALTTSCAFLALVLTSYPAFREFGFVVGTGIIACLLATIFYLPAALVLKERLRQKLGRPEKLKSVDLEFKFLGSLTTVLTRWPVFTIVAAALVTVVLSLFINDVYMNRNYMDMEPEGLESVRLQREIPKRFNMSVDNIIASVDSLEETNRLTDLLNERPAIGYVESITDYLPSPAKQAERIPLVQAIAADQKTQPDFIPVDRAALVEELYRFSDNLTEMSSLAYLSGLDRVFDKTNYFLGLDDEGESIGPNQVTKIITAIEKNEQAVARLNAFQKLFRPLMRERISTMANAEPITLDMIPDDIRERFISRDGDHYMLIVYANRDIWDGLLTSPFVETVTRDIPGASGMPLLMKAMVKTARDEGAWAFLYAFIAFFLILMADFRSLKTTIIASLPLFIALIWMLGIMGATDFPFSIVNVIGLPLILGIGIDDGVHIIHRYRVEGRAKLSYSMSSIGKAIFLTTLTTLLGFGSLIPSSYRGYGSVGKLVALGIGLCFITSIVILPAIMKIAWKNDEAAAKFFKKPA
ncbi:RND family transporter [candidate division CSSED10-310 bacterium]|uniref:RND family transporter n=1 Tax=candidate division CSSED10-310 bacterium TaxID=2855610 RepID=A0ABV6Z334_UNCC1